MIERECLLLVQEMVISPILSPTDAIEEVLRTMDLLTIELRKGMCATIKLDINAILRAVVV